MKIKRVHCGRDFERFFLGFSCEDVYREVRETIGPCKSDDLADCIARVKAIHFSIFKSSPKKPRTHASRTLFNCVAYRIGKDKKYLDFHPSVGTPLDSHFGIDCFFELKGVPASLDLTVSKMKINPKAHVVLTLDDLRKDRYHERADEIAAVLLKAV